MQKAFSLGASLMALFVLCTMLCSCDSGSDGAAVYAAETVATSALSVLGDDAPSAVLSAHEKGYTLREIVEAINSGSLTPGGDIGSITPSRTEKQAFFFDHDESERTKKAVILYLLGMIGEGYDHAQITFALTLALPGLQECGRSAPVLASCVSAYIVLTVEYYPPSSVVAPTLRRQPGVLSGFGDVPVPAVSWIVGAWSEIGSSLTGANTSSGTFTFHSDGTFTDDYDMVVRDGDGPTVTIHNTVSGTWSLDGEDLTIETGGEVMFGYAPNPSHVIALSGVNSWVITLNR